MVLFSFLVLVLSLKIRRWDWREKRLKQMEKRIFSKANRLCKRRNFEVDLSRRRGKKRFEATLRRLRTEPRWRCATCCKARRLTAGLPPEAGGARAAAAPCGGTRTDVDSSRAPAAVALHQPLREVLQNSAPRCGATRRSYATVRAAVEVNSWLEKGNDWYPKQLCVWLQPPCLVWRGRVPLRVGRLVVTTDEVAKVLTFCNCCNMVASCHILSNNHFSHGLLLHSVLDANFHTFVASSCLTLVQCDIVPDTCFRIEKKA